MNIVFAQVWIYAHAKKQFWLNVRSCEVRFSKPKINVATYGCSVDHKNWPHVVQTNSHQHQHRSTYETLLNWTDCHGFLCLATFSSVQMQLKYPSRHTFKSTPSTLKYKKYYYTHKIQFWCGNGNNASFGCDEVKVFPSRILLCLVLPAAPHRKQL